MKIFTFCLTQLLLIVTCYGQNIIRVNSFGLEPNSRVDATEAVRKALASPPSKGGVVLVFDKGRYDFWPQHCSEKVYFESNTTVVNPRCCAIVIENRQNITIDGSGSEFIFHGRMQPFTIDNSRTVVLKNFSIDWDIPFGAEAEIGAVTPHYFDLIIDHEKYPYVIEKDKLVFLGDGTTMPWGGVKWNDPIEFDRDSLEVTAQTDDDVLGENWETKYTAKPVGDGIVRIFYDNNRHLKTGNILVLRLGVRDHSGVFMVDSQDIRLEKINMYSNTGLSFLAQYCTNLTYKNVNCIPNPTKRRIMSGHDDGFHYSNCRGRITVDHCSFRGLMDDSVNVHGTAVKIVERISDRQLRCRFMHHQSIGMVWARQGEVVGFIDRTSMATIGKGKVAALQIHSPEEFSIEFTKPVPPGIGKDDALENLTWTPDVLITNSTFGHHRARGLLLSTPGKVVIDHNTFNTSGAAIVIPGDANHWFESGAVRDVTISNNTFKSSCLTSVYQFSEAVISIYPEVQNINLAIPRYHQNIRIVGNTFELFDYPALYALAVDGLAFHNNILVRSHEHEPRSQRKFNLTFEACRKVSVRGNRFQGDVLGKNIALVKTPREELNLDTGQGFVLVKPGNTS